METFGPTVSSSAFDIVYDESFGANATDNETMGDDVVMFPVPRYVGRFLQTATMTLIFVSALLGNTLVILLCLKKPREMKVSRRLILHLGILNLNMTLLVLPSVIVSAAAQDWILSNAWCMATGFFKNLFCVCIILNLVLISLDRYFSVVKPLHYHSSATVKYHGVFLGVIWCVSVLIALPPLIGWNKIMYHPSRYICTGDWSKTDSSYTLFVFIGGFIAPFTLMTFVYWTIYRAARRLMKRKQGRRLSVEGTDSGVGSVSGAGSVRVNSSSRQEQASENSTDTSGRKSTSRSSRSSRIFRRRSSKGGFNVTDEWRVAKTGVIVMASFVICWLPYYIVLMVDSVYGFGTTVPLSMPYAWWECFAMWMALSSSAINPYVYVLRSPPMRQQASKAARSVVARCRQCCEEDSRKARRRDSGRFGRYSLVRISNRFSRKQTRASDKNPKKQQAREKETDPEAQNEPERRPAPVAEDTRDQIEGVIPTAEIELVSHRKLDV
ncbi:5-hydroxytryptamine receptor 1F-like [Diadema setosum]|uniref:5-hydroxytryptamine receptor 1F-like n=1 Tax=Diadema setosum TaxID=31175 RepID=UPI003B3B37E7